MALTSTPKKLPFQKKIRTTSIYLLLKMASHGKFWNLQNLSSEKEPEKASKSNARIPHMGQMRSGRIFFTKITQ